LTPIPTVTHFVREIASLCSPKVKGGSGIILAFGFNDRGPASINFLYA